MNRIWHQMFAAVLGVAAVAGMSAAQSPPPQPLPPIIPVAAPVMASTSIPGIAIPDAMPASGGLNSGATIRSEGLHGALNQPAVAYGQYGPGCNNGCGSCKSDLGFIFGSCKSYFAPCGPVPCGGTSGACGGGATAGGCDGGCGTAHGHGRCGGLFGGGGRGCGGGLFGGGHGKCPLPTFGQPYGTGYNPCRYDSYLNH